MNRLTKEVFTLSAITAGSFVLMLLAAFILGINL